MNPNDAQAKAQQEKQRKMEEQRQQLVDSIFTAEAKERLNTLRLVKPDRARQVEDFVVQLAQRGQLGGKVGDEQLRDLLSRSAEEQKAVKIEHRKRKGEDDWDDDDEGW